jgi:hypothetical protein
MTKIIQVGKKQEPAPTVPVPKPVRKKGILAKMITIIKSDLNKSTRNIRAVISEPPPGWEEYRKFLELTGGK